MKIETRVEKLELELKLLKNEIQRTLLDIQEQVLIHYYPSLCSGGTRNGRTSQCDGGSLRAERQAHNQRRAASTSAESLFDDEDDDQQVGPGALLNGAPRRSRPAVC